MSLHRKLLMTILMVICTALAQAAPASILEQRMQRFRDGALRGFALAELPDDGREIYSESDFLDLAATGANVVRVAIQLRKCAGCAAYSWPEADVRYAERVLQRSQRHGLRVVVVLVAAPWGDQSDHWDNPALQADIVKQWVRVATRLKSYPALQGYDLLNEPVVPAVLQVAALPASSAAARWLELAQSIARALRAADPDTPLMVEPTPWALPESFWRMPALRDVPGIVYSFHLYAPHTFTHQGLPGYAEAAPYPGGGWDKARLSQALTEARRFAAQHQAPMFVGEFSCVRWAPAGSCLRYLADAVALFEAQGWGWTYHCWRCYQGWDAEVPAEVPAAQRDGYLPAHRRADSAALLLLKNALRRNATPAAER